MSNTPRTDDNDDVARHLAEVYRLKQELTAAKEKIADQEALFRAITYIANPENWIDEEIMRHPVQNSPVPGAVVTISAQKYAQKIVAEFQL